MTGTMGFEDVDVHQHVDLLVQSMRDTAQWTAVRELRDRTRPALEAADGGAVLDVGCGLADVLIELATRRPDLQCVGVDRSEAMLRQARQDASALGVDVELHTGSALALDHADATFDVVRSERVLQWLEQPEQALSEMRRVLRPGGTLVAIDTDWRTLAMDVPDRDLERRVVDALQRRPGADVGGRLRNLLLDLDLQQVEEHAATAVITDWDPQVAPAPPGFLPPEALVEILVATGEVSEEQARAFADQFTATARRGRFHFSVSMFAVTGRRPA